MLMEFTGLTMLPNRPKTGGLYNNLLNRVRYTAQVRWQYLQGLGNILWEDVCVSPSAVSDSL